MHFVLEDGDDRLVAGQDVRMDPERDLAILVVMTPPVDSAILVLGDSWPSRRLESLAGEEPFQTSLQLPGLRLEEFHILGHLDSVALGHSEGLIDRALQAALVPLPADLGTLSADPEGASGEKPPSEQGISDLELPPPRTHQGPGSFAEGHDCPDSEGSCRRGQSIRLLVMDVILPDEPLARPEDQPGGGRALQPGTLAGPAFRPRSPGRVGLVNLT
jgi:hypothetical protein